jgi:hypothetical protein
MNLAREENVRKHKRGYAILRVPLSVVHEIERSFTVRD